MTYEFIQVEKDNHVTTVTINRPERMNAVHPYTAIEMHNAFNEFEADDDQWVAIITGKGEKAFSAGNDLKFQAEHGGEKVRELRRQAPSGFGGLQTTSSTNELASQQIGEEDCLPWSLLLHHGQCVRPRCPVSRW